MKLRVVYPDGSETWDNLKEVYLNTPGGRLGILEGHVYFLGLTSEGEVEALFLNGERKNFSVQEGILIVSGEEEREVKILTTAKGG